MLLNYGTVRLEQLGEVCFDHAQKNNLLSIELVTVHISKYFSAIIVWLNELMWLTYHNSTSTVQESGEGG